MEVREKSMLSLDPNDFFHPERRSTDRFPIENQLTYKLMEARNIVQTGDGRTVNMSSCGILFRGGAHLPVGHRVELSVDWPAQLSEHCGLKLVALGKIVRSTPEAAAVRIEKYDFRTRAATAVTAGSSL